MGNTSGTSGAGIDRRTFVKGAALGLGAAATGATRAGADLVNLVLPTLGIETRNARTPVKHLVVLMMENRSVDHYLGWYGAENADFDGIQEAAFPDLRKGPGGPLVSTESWGERGRANFHGRRHPDPDHGWGGGRTELNGGACDGWLHPDTGNDPYALSTYDAEDLPVWRQLVRGWQSYDRWFCSLLGPTQPNRYYLHSGQSGGLKNNALPPELALERPEWTAGWTWPTIWTLLDRYGVTGNYYFSNLPELAYWGVRHLNRVRPIAQYFADCAAGTLGQVTFLDPWFITPEGLANDDHPHADLRLGQAFMSDVIEAFVNSRHYRNGAMVVTYDEWGGFWDHVPPPRVDDDRGTPDDPGGEDDFGQLGFRIPSTIVSPWTRGQRVDHTVYEHTSILRFIAENWALPHLTTRMRRTNSIGRAFRGFRTYDPERTFVPYDAPLDLVLEPTLERVERNLRNPPVVSDLFRLAESGFLDSLPIDLDLRFEDAFSSPSRILDALRLIR